MNLTKPLSQLKTLTGILHGSRAFGGPLLVNLGLTNKCNITCIHCYYNSPFLSTPNHPKVRSVRGRIEEVHGQDYLKGTTRMEVDADRIRALIDELLKMGVRRYQLGGSGEPFLYRDTLELIGILKHAGSRCQANTNGTLLDRETIHELVKLRFDDLRITTMAGTQTAYMRTHPGISRQTFACLEQHLSYLAQQKEAYRISVPIVTLVFIVIAQNIGSIVEFAKFAHKVRVDRVHFRPVDDIEDPGLAHVVPSPEQVSAVHEQLQEAAHYLELRGIPHNIDNFYKVFRKKLCTKELYGRIPCYYGWLATIVDVDGHVFPCCRCYTPLGNVYEESFSVIWHGNSYRQFREEGRDLPKRRAPVRGCDCYSCVHHSANLRMYEILHPLRRRC